MISIISPAFQTFPILVPSLLLQTEPDWELVICHDGPLPVWEEWVNAFQDPRIRWRSTRERVGNFGHPLREVMMKDEPLHGRYLWLTNHDNWACPQLVATLEQQTADVVAWPIIHNYFQYQMLHPRLQLGSIDLSSVAVRTDIARDVGWPWREHSSDWLYIQEVAKRTCDWKFLDSCLGAHN